MIEYYDKNLIIYIKKNHQDILAKDFLEWFLIVEPILLNDEFQKRKLFVHHENESLLKHSICVSYLSYELAKKLNANVKECAIAGLLHDFYTNAWQYSKDLELLDSKYLDNYNSKIKPKFLQMHGFIHPIEALNNANQYFEIYINDKIKDAIVKHMFPLSLLTKYRLPKYKESWVVTIADKIVSFTNFPKLNQLPKYVGIGKKLSD